MGAKEPPQRATTQATQNRFHITIVLHSVKLRLHASVCVSVTPVS